MEQHAPQSFRTPHVENPRETLESWEVGICRLHMEVLVFILRVNEWALVAHSCHGWIRAC